jgi:hypothetical protein
MEITPVDNQSNYVLKTSVRYGHWFFKAWALAYYYKSYFGGLTHASRKRVFIANETKYSSSNSYILGGDPFTDSKRVFR